MLKRFTILGFVLLLAGSAMLAWFFTETRKEQQQCDSYKSRCDSEFRKELQQSEQLLSAFGELPAEPSSLLTELGRSLHSGSLQSGWSIDFLREDNQQQKPDKTEDKKKFSELVLNGSIMSMSIGGIIFVPCFLLYFVRIFLKVLCILGSVFQKFSGSSAESETTGLLDDLESTVIKPDSSDESEQAQENPYRFAEAEPEQKVSVSSGQKGRFNFRQIESRSGTNCPPANGGSTGAEGPDDGSTSNKSIGTLRLPTPRSEINGTLTELTQQVAAIREYAASQQDRVRRLQDGYDWNIIRNFCLRIIRCIDNLDNRINRRSGHKGETSHLKEVRDELIFSLESSGVERFEPEINTDYRGQEKFAEAVKERKSCEDSGMVGKIAKIVRPGYQYFITEDNVKVVRPAMVILFG